LEIPASARPHPARRSQPARALLAIRPGLRRRVGDELTPLQRSPKRLNLLVNHDLSKDSHRHPSNRRVLRRPREPKLPYSDTDREHRLVSLDAMLSLARALEIEVVSVEVV
jgi:hypothetical protein